MSGMSTYLAQRAIQHFVQRSAQTVPGATYLALFTAEVLDDGTCPSGGEPSGAWYGRQNVAAWSAPVTNTTGTYTTNSAQLSFTACDTATTVAHWAIFDALTGGNMLYSGAMAVPKTINVDDVFTVKTGELNLEFR